MNFPNNCKTNYKNSKINYTKFGKFNFFTYLYGLPSLIIIIIKND